MKSSKSPGPDGIPPKIFKVFNRPIITCITLLFNKILESGQFPKEWGLGVICPIHKKGSEEDPNNYRGITLLNTIAKIFTSIINNRILNWVEDNNILNETQFGFRKGRRTSDGHFILLSLIENFRHTKNPLFSCFVDFSKAFDSISHDLLWLKMEALGLSTRILLLLKDMYSKACSCIKVNGSLSPCFTCNRGVRQGCNLSPLLFCLFISDLETHLKNNNCHGVRLTNSQLPLLLFADDVLLFGNSPENLQKSLHALQSYCNTWNLSVNLSKTKIMIFKRKNVKVSHTTFMYNGLPVEVVDEYKYLGLVFTSNGLFTRASSVLASQANKALFALFKKASHLGYPDPSVMCHLFNSLVLPVLEYGGVIWGNRIFTVIERVHLRFCKFVLGVPTSACNLACYGELGRYPVEIRIKISLIKFWLRLATDWNIPPLLYDAYQLSLSTPGSWCARIKQILDVSGFSFVWINPNKVDQSSFIEELSERLSCHYQQSWASSLHSTTGKLRTYKLLKRSLSYESYLDLPPHMRVTLTRFRISAHHLHIETGRYACLSPVPVEERHCAHCVSTIEDEPHFLLNCPNYSNLRAPLLELCNHLLPSFSHLSTMDQFIYILTRKDRTFLRILAKYLNKAFEQRNTTI